MFCAEKALSLPPLAHVKWGAMNECPFLVAGLPFLFCLDGPLSVVAPFRVIRRELIAK
jgi:hypothetical protein